MAEIPEHLLRRSKERRAAAGGDGDAAATPTATGADAPTSAVAKTEAAAPVASAPPLPTTAPQPKQPDALPKGRARFPAWVMPVLAVLPVFGFFYAQAFQTPPVEAPTDPLVLGEELYRTQGCSGCHGGAGEGGVGPALAGEESELTFPDPADHAKWIVSGSSPFAGQGYGDPDRPGGQRQASGGMPAFANLTPEEIEALVRYEREKL